MTGDPTSYLEVDNPRVLAFRFRTDVDTNRQLAKHLRLRADLLDAAADACEGADTPSVERITQVAQQVDGHSTHSDPWMRARVIRHMAATGDCHWHANWMMYGRQDGRACDCAPCQKAAKAAGKVTA